MMANLTNKRDTIAEARKMFPGLKITIDPALNNSKRDPNSKKIKDIKKILVKIKMPPNPLNTSI